MACEDKKGLNSRRKKTARGGLGDEMGKKSAVLELSLRPYPGTIKLCASRNSFYREHKKLFGDKGKDLTYNRGRMVGKWDDRTAWPTYVVWAERPAYLAHEMAHVVLHVFDLAGIDPVAAGGEPFCCLLSQLLIDADR